jgi:hypothetical protein
LQLQTDKIREGPSGINSQYYLVSQSLLTALNRRTKRL